MKMAVIPARGGSKRIPKKNIKEFCGKPMLAWSIEAAQRSKIFDLIIVSTDDEEIAEVAKHYGAQVPFLRPNELADDHTGTTEVIAHAIQWAKNNGHNLEAVCCIYATAPFVDACDLILGLEALKSENWDYTFSACEYPASIYRAFSREPHDGVSMVFPEHFNTRSQDLPTALHDAAQFYWGRPRSWLEKKVVFAETSKAIVLPRWRVQDIDTPEDWHYAELLFSSLNNVGGMV